MADTTTHSVPTRPKGKKRWFLRILIGLAGLVVLVASVVQIVLWTDLPRGIVVKQLEKQLGLRLTVKSFSTGWLGNTKLTDVTIALPLADKAFLDVPTMRVKNTSLFGLMLGRSVDVEAIELDRPHLSVWQDGGGKWNIQEVAELLARTAGGTTAQQSAADSSSSSVQMPNVRLVDGVVSVIDNKSRKLDISPLNVDGERDTAVSWKYDVRVPSHVAIAGRLVPGGTWAHDVSINIQDIGAWAKPWMADFPPVVLEATWRGQLNDTGVGGRLDIKKATVVLTTGTAEASGAVTASFAAGVLKLKPGDLKLKTGQKALPDLAVAGGTITYAPASDDVKADQLLVIFLGGAAHVSADYNVNAKSGSIGAEWQKLALPNGVTHSGSFSATLARPFPNQVVANGDLKWTGDCPSGPWKAIGKFHADGESFANFGWTIDAPTLRWDRKDEAINISGLAVAGDWRHEKLVVRSLKLPGSDILSGAGSYQFTQNQPWTVNLRGQHWPFHPISGIELGFEVQAHGGIEQVTTDAGYKLLEVVTLENFLLKSPDSQFSAKGTYTVGIPAPVKLEIDVTNAPATQAPVAFAAAPRDKILSGTIAGHAGITGTLNPPMLSVMGHVDGREIDIRGHHFGEISAVISNQSRINSDGVFIYTDSLKLFGGNWDLDGIYRFDAAGLAVDVAMRDVKLKEAAEAVGQQGISGSLEGKVQAFVPGLHPDPASIQVSASDFIIKDLVAPGIVIDSVDATLAVSGGTLQLNPIRVARRDGRGNAFVAVNINDLRHIDLGAAISNWPIDIPGAKAGVTASLDIPHMGIELPNAASSNPDLRKIQVDAPRIDLSGSTTLQGDQLGSIAAHVGIHGRQIDLRGLHMKLLGGRLDGQAYADLDRPIGATAEFTWQQLEFKKLALIFPELHEMSGEMNGSLRLAPATVPRPREPLALVIENQFSHGAWRTMPIKDFRIAAYIGPNQQSPGAGWRVVLEDNNIDPSYIHADKGTIELWGRFATHGNSISSQAQITLHDIDLNTAVHALDPDASAMPGKLNGPIMLIRVPAPPQQLPAIALARMFPGQPPNPLGAARPAPQLSPPLQALIEPIYGEGSLTLTQANLLKFRPFAFVYNAANLFQHDKSATGEGNVEFHLERGSLSIERLRYFNRGTEIRAVATIGKLWKFPDSPLNGTVYVTARPLRDLKLPLLSDFDSVLTSVQTSLALTGARAEGTIKDYKIIGPLGVTDMTDEMARFLVGDVKKEQAAAGE